MHAGHAQVRGVLFKIANGPKLQLQLVVAALFAITLIPIPQLAAWWVPYCSRFNNARPFVSHKFAQPFTQYIKMVHQVEPQPKIDPQLHVPWDGGRLSPAKRFISLLNCEMSQHFRLLANANAREFVSIFLPAFLSYSFALFLVGHLSVPASRPDSQLYLCTWFTARIRIKSYLLCVPRLRLPLILTGDLLAWQIVISNLELYGN